MSSYTAKAINPLTGQLEDAWFLDDYYGRHQYGIQFKDGYTYRPDKVKVPSRKETAP